MDAILFSVLGWFFG